MSSHQSSSSSVISVKRNSVDGRSQDVNIVFFLLFTHPHLQDVLRQLQSRQTEDLLQEAAITDNRRLLRLIWKLYDCF